MDVSFPLSYNNYGSLQLVDGSSKYTSQIKHLLNTVVTERLLSPNFGFPIDLLYNLPLPDLVAERIRLAIAPYLPIPFAVKINAPVNGKLGIEVAIGEEEPEVIIYDLRLFA
jgi:hypothetical protein